MSLQVPATEVVQMLMQDDVPTAELCIDADRARRSANWDQAIELCYQGMSLCSEASLESEYCRAVVQVHLGAVYHSMGADDEAEQWYNAGADLFHVLDYCYSSWNEAAASYGLGLIAQSRPEFESARALYLQSLRLFSQASKCQTLKGDDKKVLERHIRRVEERIKQIRILACGETSAGLPKGTVSLSIEGIIVGRTLQLDGQIYQIRKTVDTETDAVFRPRLSDRYHAVKVDGFSMIEAGINHKDYVIVREQPRVETGEIAVVLVDGPSIDVLSTVKRFYRQGDCIRLKAANSQFKPQEQVFRVSDPTIRILGKVMAVATPCSDHGQR
jgi:hypothetical protein